VLLLKFFTDLTVKIVVFWVLHRIICIMSSVRNLNLKSASSSESYMTTCQTTRRHVLEYNNINRRYIFYKRRQPIYLLINLSELISSHD
jgi:hypothetical protein